MVVSACLRMTARARLTCRNTGICPRLAAASSPQDTLNWFVVDDIFTGAASLGTERCAQSWNGERKISMIKSLIGFLCAGVLFVAIANGQVSTVTGTESTGKITDYTPDSALVLDTGSGEPVHYKFAKRVTYVDKDGQTIQAPALTKNLRVKVHYVKQGGDLIVDKVTLAE